MPTRFPTCFAQQVSRERLYRVLVGETKAWIEEERLLGGDLFSPFEMEAEVIHSKLSAITLEWRER